MVASLLIDREETRALAGLLEPEPLADGTIPEQRLIICGISWPRYLDLDKALGDDRPSRHLYYLDGDLEIMTTSKDHERIKKWIGGFLDIYFDDKGIEITPHGQATMRIALKQVGAEPDESWSIGDEKEWPDLVLEIALTSSGVDKLEIYRRFNIREVWIWSKNQLNLFALSQDSARYDPVQTSRLLPDLDIRLIQRCVGIRSWQDARRAFRTGLVKQS